ncbi:hypothetical protein DL765_007809 [Monosporascus sp. GIB2]|nr:hypothetical protein DL765_007809 [Monosporascus sp. GIB2]
MAELDRQMKYIKLLDAAPRPPPADFKMPATSELLFHLPKPKIAALTAAAFPPGAFPRFAALVRESMSRLTTLGTGPPWSGVAGLPDKRRIGLSYNGFLGPDMAGTSRQDLTAHKA